MGRCLTYNEVVVGSIPTRCTKICPRGEARISRLPAKEKNAGLNPAEDTIFERNIMAHTQVQVEVSHRGQHLVTWVEDDSRIKPGVKIELKNQVGLWNVERVYRTKIDQQDLNRSWRVGGL